MDNIKIRVLIVEDSLVGQKLLKGLVLSDDRFELVAVAENGKQAFEFVQKYNPDVVSMDIQMPIMDGVDSTRKIMQENPVPVVIVSSHYNSSELEIAMKVLEVGAVTIIARPFGPGHPKFGSSSKQYLNTLKMMSEVKVVRRRRPVPIKSLEKSEELTLNVASTVSPENTDSQVLAIGASAGGPEGIRTILSNLPFNFPVPVVIVQHIDSQFVEGFCTWLNTCSSIPVHIANDNEKALPGHAYLPPGNHHLSVKAKGILSVTPKPDNLINRQSVNILFSGISEVYGRKSTAVLLSGMGKDGALGLKTLHDLGAMTYAQSEHSCLVFGMPGEAVKLNAASKVMSPEDIVKEICLTFDKK